MIVFYPSLAFLQQNLQPRSHMQNHTIFLICIFCLFFFFLVVLFVHFFFTVTSGAGFVVVFIKYFVCKLYLCKSKKKANNELCVCVGLCKNLHLFGWLVCVKNIWKFYTLEILDMADNKTKNLPASATTTNEKKTFKLSFTVYGFVLVILFACCE